MCALVVAAPFELMTPVFALPRQSVTSVEAVIALVLAVWGAGLLWTRQMPPWRTTLTLPWLALIAATLAAALAAPAHRANAAHMVGRFTIAFAVFLLTVNGVTTWTRLRRVLVAAAVSGALVSVLIVLEYFDVRAVSTWLGHFRERTIVVGTQIRASGPFQYPTIASMYLEIVFALVLALLATTLDTARRGLSLLTFVLLALIAAAVTFTFTRAGLVTLVLAIGMVSALRFRQRGFDASLKTMIALAMVIAIQVVALRSAESVVLRATTEGQRSWYRAQVDAPPHLEIAAGASIAVPVTLTNTGRSTWDSSADAALGLSYHWLDSTGERVVDYEGVRTPLPTAVPPGATVAMEARVKAPNVPGRYRLLWDVVIERRLWFSMDPDAPRFFSEATITGTPTGPAPVPRITTMPRVAAPEGRLALWRAAVDMVKARPLFGVGPDNFRLVYGEYLGLEHFDTRVHSNNMYVELLAGAGIVGAAAFAWLGIAAATTFFRATRQTAAEFATTGAGIGAAGLAIAAHGLVDSFLSFTASYLLISITLGLAVACAWIDREAATAA